jgi:hypothetical protein
MYPHGLRQKAAREIGQKTFRGYSHIRPIKVDNNHKKKEAGSMEKGESQMCFSILLTSSSLLLNYHGTYKSTKERNH